MGSRKQPTPPPIGTAKPDPPPAPPLKVGSFARSVEVQFTGDTEKLRQYMEAAVARPSPPPGHLGDAGIFARLDSFRDLEPGWDSYGAPAIDPRAIAKAQKLLRSLTVVPTSRGGVQIEAYADGAVLEAEIDADGRLVEDEGVRPWIFCADSLPETAGRYEVAAWLPGVLKGDPLRLYRAYSFYHPTEPGREMWRSGDSIHDVYAWRPITEDPPPLRPADRDHLLAAGVPAEWLEPKGD